MISGSQAAKLQLMEIKDFKLYKKYKLTDLVDAFHNGSFYRGPGMVYDTKTNVLILTSKYTKGRIYQDEIKNGKIFYTGMGQEGDQKLAFGNKRLVDAKRDGTTVYMFLVFKDGEFTYYGRVELDGDYDFVPEPDKNGNPRHVFKFPLRFIDAFAPISPKELEKHVVAGQIPIIEVVGACFSEGSKVLLAQRGDGHSLAGKWEFPGGKVEKGETKQQALIREIKEELDADISVSDEVETTLNYNPSKTALIRLTVFKAAVVSGELKAKEHKQLKMFEIADLEGMIDDLCPNDIKIAQALIDTLPRSIVEVVDFGYKTGKKKTPKKSEIKRASQDYEKSQRKKAKAGAQAEKAVMNYEAGRLHKLGRDDLAEQIKQVSLISADYGYDILSFDLVDGKVEEVHIEVKSATFNGSSIEFFISQAELRNCKDDPNYQIYALWNFGSNYKMHIINKEKFLSDDNYCSPLNYKVSIPIEML